MAHGCAGVCMHVLARVTRINATEWMYRFPVVRNHAHVWMVFVCLFDFRFFLFLKIKWHRMCDIYLALCARCYFLFRCWRTHASRRQYKIRSNNLLILEQQITPHKTASSACLLAHSLTQAKVKHETENMLANL